MDFIVIIEKKRVPGWAGRLVDVIIDGIGALLGCLVFALIVTKMVKNQ